MTTPAPAAKKSTPCKGKWPDAFDLLVIFLIFTSVMRCLYAYLSIKVSDPYQIMEAVGESWLITLWVIEDSKDTNYRPCYEYSAFLFFLLPVLFPHYLFRTRGIRGLLVLGAFLILLAIPAIVASYIDHR
jgi:hypothetical protein